MNKIALSFLLLVAALLLVLPAGAVNASAPAASSAYSSGLGPVRITEGYRPHPRDPSSAPSSIPGPQVAELQTVPAVPGVTFQVAGQQFVTGADGSTVIMVPKPGDYDLQVITDTFQDPYRRVEFSRWLSESFEPTRQVHLPAKEAVQVGLNVYELVGQKFRHNSGLVSMVVANRHPLPYRGDYDAARESFTKAWDIAQQTTTPNDPVRYDVLKRLTSVRAAAGLVISSARAILELPLPQDVGADLVVAPLHLVELVAVKKHFEGAKAVDGVDLKIKNGEFMVFLGPSGGGKTTLMRLCAGLEKPTEGKIIIDGEIVNDLPPRERGIAMVFQNYALYPHKSVFKT